MGVRGDKIQNTLWRIQNLFFPHSLSVVFILCGTNNLDKNSSEDISNGIIVSAKEIQKDLIPAGTQRRVDVTTTSFYDLKRRHYDVFRKPYLK